MNFLAGYRTYVVAGLLIICGGLELFGITIPGMAGSPTELIMTGIGLLTGRAATAKVAASP